MTRDIDIDFGFTRLPSFRELLETFRMSGVVPERDGMLTVTTDGDFTWERRGITELNVVLREMERTLSAGQSVGSKMHWLNQDRRGTVLVMPAHNTVSFIPDVDTLWGGPDATLVGLGWYLDELATILEPFSPTATAARNTR